MMSGSSERSNQRQNLAQNPHPSYLESWVIWTDPDLTVVLQTLREIVSQIKMKQTFDADTMTLDTPGKCGSL